MELIAKNMHHVFSIRIQMALQCSNFTVMVSGETLFSCKCWLSITPKHFLWESLFQWRSYYFLVNKDWMSGFSMNGWAFILEEPIFTAILVFVSWTSWQLVKKLNNMNQRHWRKHTNLSRNNIIFYVQKKPFGVLQELVTVTK